MWITVLTVVFNQYMIKEMIKQNNWGEQLKIDFNKITLPLELTVGDVWRDYVDRYNQKMFGFILLQIKLAEERTQTRIEKVVDGSKKTKYCRECDISPFGICKEGCIADSSIYNQVLTDLLQAIRKETK